MGSAGEGSCVAACCEWAKAALFRLPDVHRSGVRGVRLWCGSKFQLFLFGCALIQISLSERKNGHNTAKNSLTSVVQYKPNYRLFSTLESHTVRRADYPLGGLH